MFNHDYYDRISYEQIFWDFVEEDMEEQRAKTIETIGTIVGKLDHAESFAKILCVALDEECKEAMELWSNLGLDASHFFAIHRNKKEYFEIKQKEKGNQIGSDEYWERYYE
jgi:hypothetical protein